MARLPELLSPRQARITRTLDHLSEASVPSVPHPAGRLSEISLLHLSLTVIDGATDKNLHNRYRLPRVHTTPQRSGMFSWIKLNSVNAIYKEERYTCRTDACLERKSRGVFVKVKRFACNAIITSCGAISRKRGLPGTDLCREKSFSR